jgi:DNA-binding TFAR19-related protein (PDSD5 family)
MSLPDLDPRYDDLVRELRGARPQPSAALVQRVARIAEAPATPIPAARRWRRPALVLVPALTLVLAGVGASLLLGGGSGRRNVAGGEPSRQATVESLQAAPTAQSGLARTQSKQAPQPKALAGAADSAATGATLPPAPFRATEEHASFTLQVKDRDELAHQTQVAMRIVRTLGGYVVSAQTSQPGDGQGDSTLLVKVPIGHVQQAITRLSGLGRILSQNIQLQDLQAPINQQRDRAQQLQAAIAQLEQGLLSRTLTPEARARIEGQLALDRAQLAAARRAQASLLKRGRLATIELAFTTRSNAQPVAPKHPGQARRTLTHAWNLLGRELAFVGAGVLLIAPFALLVALALAARRVWRRREEARLLAATR